MRCRVRRGVGLVGWVRIVVIVVVGVVAECGIWRCLNGIVAAAVVVVEDVDFVEEVVENMLVGWRVFFLRVDRVGDRRISLDRRRRVGRIVVLVEVEECIVGEGA